MEILKILDEFEEWLESSTKLPLAKKIIINKEEALDLIDKIRTSLPEEIRQASWIKSEREQVLKEAEAEVEKIIAQAQEKANYLVSENEITLQSQKKAQEITDHAYNLTREIREGADKYADETLEKMEEYMEKALETIKMGRQQLRR